MRRKILNDTIHFNYLSKQCDLLIGGINNSVNFQKFIRTSSELRNITFHNLKICSNNYNIAKNNKNIVINLFNTFY